MDKLLRSLDRFAAICVISLMGVMSVITFVAVFFRFVMHSPLAWTEEVARYMMVWVTFMGAGLAMGKGRHIGVTMALDLLPRRLRLIADAVAKYIMAAFFCAMIYYGAKFTLNLRTQVSPALGLPMIFPYIAVPIGCFYMLLQILLLGRGRNDGEASRAADLNPECEDR